jgi:putative transposase
MRQMRANATLELQQEQRAELEKVARSRRTPQAVAQRVRIVLMTAAGISPSAIGEQLGVSQPTVRKWRARYGEDGLAGLPNEPRPGRQRTGHPDERTALRAGL